MYSTRNRKQRVPEMFLTNHMALAAALLDFVTRPVDLLIREWNRKAAFSSALVCALIFFFANLPAG
jgi:hypothetical protein